MTRKSTTERQIEIIIEATRMLGATGYHSVTTKALSKKIGIAEMILYRCFKNKDAIVLACILDTGKKQMENWHKIVATEIDPLEALFHIAADFSYNPSSESVGFQLLQRLCAEQLEPSLSDAIASIYTQFCNFLEEHLNRIISYHRLNEQKQEKVRHLAWVLVHWGSGLGQMQFLPIDEAHTEEFKSQQISLAMNFIKDHLWCTPQ